MPAERACERAGLRETERHADLRHRPIPVGKQHLGTLDAASDEVAMRRCAERVLEGAGKMEWAQPRDLGERRERHVLREVLLDEFRDPMALPSRKPAAVIIRVELAACLTSIETKKLVGKQDAQGFCILLPPDSRLAAALVPELRCDGPQTGVAEIQARLELGLGKAQLWIEQRAARIDDEISDPREHARTLPAVEAVPAWDEAQAAADVPQGRLRQALDQRLAVVALAALDHDEQMACRACAVFERLAPHDLDGVHLDSGPPGDFASRDIPWCELHRSASNGRRDGA